MRPNGRSLAPGLVLAVALACLSAVGPVLAQGDDGARYPAKPVRLVIPFAPGGNTDVIGRIITEHMGQTLGQKLVIENVAGAGGTTGALRVARARPDGYTILVGQVGTHGASVGLFPNLDLVTIDKDFGGWAKAQPAHFGDGGTFDQLYQPKR